MTRRIERITIALLAASATFTASARAESPPTWEQAVASVQAAAQTLETRPAEARLKLLEAAAVFDRASQDQHLSPAGRAAADFNAGKARLLAGDVPGAMLALKRAQLADPALPGLNDALSTARSKAGAPAPASTATESPKPTDPPATSPLDLTRALLNRIPAAAYLALAFLAACAASSAIAVRTLARPNRPHRLGGFAFCAFALAALAALALLTARWPSLTSRDAVLMATGVTPRSSPGLSAPVVAGLTLNPGVELRILETSASPDGLWLRCVMPESPLTTPFWVNADAAETVRRGWLTGQS